MRLEFLSYYGVVRSVDPKQYLFLPNLPYLLITLFCLPSLIFGKFGSVFRHALLIIVSRTVHFLLIRCLYSLMLVETCVVHLCRTC
jgi:hypothetical protein